MGWVLFFGILDAFFMLFAMDPATREVSAMGIVFSSAAFAICLWAYLWFHKDDRQIEEKRYSEELLRFPGMQGFQKLFHHCDGASGGDFRGKESFSVCNCSSNCS